MSSSNSLSLKFVSDDDLEFPGFKASVEFISVTEGHPTTNAAPTPAASLQTTEEHAITSTTLSTAAEATTNAVVEVSSTAEPIAQQKQAKSKVYEIVKMISSDTYHVMYVLLC